MEENIDKNYQLALPEELAAGNYSNLAIISHSATEFIFDFAMMRPGLKKSEVCDRIVMAPEHAKRLLLALQDNIAKYENTYSMIKLNQSQSQKKVAPLDINKGEA